MQAAQPRATMSLMPNSLPRVARPSSVVPWVVGEMSTAWATFERPNRLM
jgi:hypothetical protein